MDRDEIPVEDPPGWDDDAMDAPAGTQPAGAGHIWSGLGRVKTSTREPSLSDKLGQMFGTGRGGRPDTRKAAEELGVSQRTVQRWLADGKPSAKRASDVEGAYDAWRKDPARRGEAMNSRREARMRKHGTTIRFAGQVRISTDKRRRSKEIAISGEELAPILDAALAGNDEAAHAAFERFVISAGVFGGECAIDIDVFETKG